MLIINETFSVPQIAFPADNKAEPYCWDSEVFIHKYRITIERIEEPIEVLQARLQKLKDESKNMHHRDAIWKKATELNIVLK